MKDENIKVSFTRRLIFGTGISTVVATFTIFMKIFLLPFNVSSALIFFSWIMGTLASALATYIPEINFKLLSKKV